MRQNLGTRRGRRKSFAWLSAPSPLAWLSAPHPPRRGGGGSSPASLPGGPAPTPHPWAGRHQQRPRAREWGVLGGGGGWRGEDPARESQCLPSPLPSPRARVQAAPQFPEPPGWRCRPTVQTLALSGLRGPAPAPAPSPPPLPRPQPPRRLPYLFWPSAGSGCLWAGPGGAGVRGAGVSSRGPPAGGRGTVSGDPRPPGAGPGLTFTLNFEGS
ncbi:hypothetical protein [Murine herpesvirus strain 4556]|uniref:Uncharacterized protein n=2 Tax=Orthoherpesviridae TaxID=3044472 RepID=O41980_MHV68|nr:unknown [Murid gammaherpesvirus 4]AXP99185.1 unknown protein [synthetic construct]QPD95867.1 hypothetical protein [Murine herpesvirus]UNZ86710.1 hypothetical protein [Murine herpesvirus strain 72]UNZ86787.1 hypothetical protein [Murine herpesvirus strain 4556]AAB66426.1 unknown [Murid gammaherpesvirus 4]